VLELTSTIAGVLTDFEHCSDEDLYLDRLVSRGRRCDSKCERKGCGGNLGVFAK
jgi:hypothetical protein